MNTREFKQLKYAVEAFLPIACREKILSALSLQAAAEANDGSTPLTDEEEFCPGCLIDGEEHHGAVDVDFARALERERNGLAAEVVRLTEDAERLRFQYSCYVKTCAAVNLGGAMTYDKWVAAIDAERAK